MATSPPISPVVATPLAHRKRRHSEMTREAIIDLTGSDDDGESVGLGRKDAKKVRDMSPTLVNGSGSGHGVETERKLEDESSQGDVDDLLSSMEDLEDILDTAELEPWKAGDHPEERMGLKPEVIAHLHARLLEVGPDQFFEEVLGVAQMSPALLGTAFGLPPWREEQLGEVKFMIALGKMVGRAYYKRQKLPQYNTIDDAAELLRTCNRIMVITGAGISTSLGIPDFRSKETGFYTKLQEEGITEPEEVFDIRAFDEDPRVFYKLAHGILPDESRYTPTHGFIRLLQDKGKLQTNYTQNIDNIEERAGIDKHRLIQCHGSFASATCRKCHHKVKGTEIFPDIRAQRVAKCKRCIEDIAAIEETAPQKKKVKKPKPNYSSSDSDDNDNIPSPGTMKPDITFFGEALPDDFFTRFTEHDSKDVDLVLVIGTSLKVAPVSEMPNYLPHHVPHIYISREPIGHVNFDVQLLGDCDAVVFELCRRAGWGLVHEMIPKGFEVEVEGVDGEGLGHVWFVEGKGGKSTEQKAVANGVSA